jgi:hypothetical protein
MSGIAATPQTPAIDQPRHPLHALTTYELAYYGRRLENAIAFLDKQAPFPDPGRPESCPGRRDRRAGRPRQDPLPLMRERDLPR